MQALGEGKKGVERRIERIVTCFDMNREDKNRWAEIDLDVQTSSDSKHWHLSTLSAPTVVASTVAQVPVLVIAKTHPITKDLCSFKDDQIS